MTEHEPLSVLDTYQRHGAAWAKLRGDTLEEGSWLDLFAACCPLAGQYWI